MKIYNTNKFRFLKRSNSTRKERKRKRKKERKRTRPDTFHSIPFNWIPGTLSCTAISIKSNRIESDSESIRFDSIGLKWICLNLRSWRLGLQCAWPAWASGPETLLVIRLASPPLLTLLLLLFLFLYSSLLGFAAMILFASCTTLSPLIPSKYFFRFGYLSKLKPINGVQERTIYK